MDIIGVPFLPLDISIRHTNGVSSIVIERLLKEWATHRNLAELSRTLASIGLAGDRFAVCPGGSAANALRVAQAWGCQTAIAGVLADDAPGNHIRALDTAAGIDLSWVHPLKGEATPVSLLLVRGNVVSQKSLVPQGKHVRSLFQLGQDPWRGCVQHLRQMAPLSTPPGVDPVRRKIAKDVL